MIIPINNEIERSKITKQLSQTLGYKVLNNKDNN